MTNAVVSRLGQINQSGDDRAIFLKVFSGEVLTAFSEKNVMADKHMVRSITHGKSAQFPVTGTFDARYHKVGDEILGQKSNHNERIITIDDMLISDSFIANIDEAMNHYAIRSEYSKKQGEALANTYDRQVLRTVYQASQAVKSILTKPKTSGHTVTLDTTFNTGKTAIVKSEALITAINDAVVTFDETDIPENERYVFLSPSSYSLLSQNTKLQNHDWGGTGVYSDGTVLRIAGCTLVKTNHLPNVNDTTTDPDYLGGGTAPANTPDTKKGAKTVQGKYTVGDASKLVALVMQKEAVGTVKLMDLAVESEYQISRQGTLMVAKYALGHGVLRAECATAIMAP